MSDLETFKSMLERSGVPFSESTLKEEVVITIEGGTERTRGYGGFQADLYFTIDGKLITVGAGES